LKILGLDVGSKRVGLAVSDELGLVAGPLTVLARDDLGEVARVIEEEKVREVVIGLPRRSDGSYGPEAAEVRAYAEELRAAIPEHVKVTFWDERFSTVSAERYLIEADVRRRRRREIIDKVAASLILQAYLDHRNRHNR